MFCAYKISMKTFILLILLKLSIFASPILDTQRSYEQLNQEIDALFAKFTAEERVSLYFLVLSTHDKIASAYMLGQEQTQALVELQKETFATLDALSSNKNISAKEIENLRLLYSLMYHTPHDEKEEHALEPQESLEIKDATTLYLVLILGSVFLGLLLGFLFFKKPHAQVIHKIDDALLVDLQEKYNNTLDELKALERQKEFWQTEVQNSNEHLKNEKQSLDKEIQELKAKTIELQNSHEVLISTFQQELVNLSS